MKKVLMAAVVAFMMLGASMAFAQDNEDEPFFNVNAELAVGWGSYFSEEEDTFSQAAQFATLSADILDIDLFDATSGIGAEIQFGGDLEYTLWSLNRATVPGTNNRLYGGSDLKLIQSTEDGGAEGDFDMRLVLGYRLAKVGPGELLFEFYTIEENRPVAFALKYGF